MYMYLSIFVANLYIYYRVPVPTSLVWLGAWSLVANDFKFLSTGTALNYFNWGVSEPYVNVAGLVMKLSTGFLADFLSIRHGHYFVHLSWLGGYINTGANFLCLVN